MDKCSAHNPSVVGCFVLDLFAIVCPETRIYPLRLNAFATNN